ncbi:helix-turn-helix domain-containing protein [Priestia megaterium]|uniref:helix-turn-helix domain-containing protein n=1 Tax=Priestia megaterium TaxID=1404 RepID=UPI00211C812C|nr:helix-turn-helix domain-containing protein [Priestia megaterium]
MDYYKNNHINRTSYGNIKEASESYKQWKDDCLKSSFDHNVKFGFRPIFEGFNEMVAEKELNASEMKVYLLLTEYANLTTGMTDISNSFIVEKSKLKQRTVETAVTSLEKKGLIFRNLGHDENNRLTRMICLLPYEVRVPQENTDDTAE